jgi:hypothetical protein
MPKPPQSPSAVFPNPQAVYYLTPAFEDSLEQLQPPKRMGQIIGHIRKFEQYCQTGRIPSNFDFKKIESAAGCYSLWQIRAGNDYRAFVMFFQKSLDAYWIYVWKKSSQNDEADVARGAKYASDWWNEVQKGQP